MKHYITLIVGMMSAGAILTATAQPERDINYNPNFGDAGQWKWKGGAPFEEGGRITMPKGRENAMERDTAEVYIDIYAGEAGYYDITAEVSIVSNEGICKLYAKGKDYTEASTEIPMVGAKEQTRTVCVRSAGTADGTLRIGIRGDGRHDVAFQNVRVRKAKGEYKFLQGGDITMLNYVLANGGEYRGKDGEALYAESATIEEKAEAVMRFMAEKGVNFVRIRNSNNPGEPDPTGKYCLTAGFQDTEDCLSLARMAHSNGMAIQYTFNLSDYWSNGERQTIPVDWQEKINREWNAERRVDILAECVRGYVTSVMQGMAAEGIYPEYVSIGNETNAGFLFPYAYSYDVGEDIATADMPIGKKNYAAMAKILNAGYEAVKAVSPESRVVIHTSDCVGDIGKWGSPSTYEWYYNILKTAGAKYDVIGISYYPSWSESTVDALVRTCKSLFGTFGKDILIMESGYNFAEKRKDGYDGQLNHNAKEYYSLYPYSPSGQKGFVCELLNSLKLIGAEEGNGREVVGSLYWDPMMIHVEDEWGNNKTGWADFYGTGKSDVNVVENTTFFDFDGRALSVFEAYDGGRYSYYKEDEEEDESEVRIIAKEKKENDDEGIYDMCGRRINDLPKEGVYIKGGKKFRK